MTTSAKLKFLFLGGNVMRNNYLNIFFCFSFGFSEIQRDIYPFGHMLAPPVTTQLFTLYHRVQGCNGAYTASH